MPVCTVLHIVTTQFNKSRVFQRLQIALRPSDQTRAILIVFEKVTRACFFQIALETMLLRIRIKKWCIYTR